MRPRVLYGCTFSFLALSGGRFTAPFLESEASFSEGEVGLALALQCACSSILAALGGGLADRSELRHRHGRVCVMAVGIVFMAVSFLLHGVGHVCPGAFFEPPRGSSSHALILIWHFGLRIFYAVGLSLSLPVLDGLTLAYLQAECKEQTEYGKERLHGAIWWAISNVIIGPIIDLWGFQAMYAATLVAFTTLMLAICKYVADQESKTRTYKTMHNTTEGDGGTTSNDEFPSASEGELDNEQLRRNPSDLPLTFLLKIMCGSLFGAGFLISFFTLSIGTSVVESLIFLYFGYLGGSNTVCGLSVVVTVLFEIPIFHVAPKLLQWMGPGGMQHLACVAYVIRVLGYSLIPEDRPALVLFLEPLHGVTYACSKTSGVEFAERLMPRGYEASGQGILALFSGMGSFFGLSLGGMAEEFFGPRLMYRGLSVIVALGMVMFGLASSATNDGLAGSAMVDVLDGQYGVSHNG